MWKNCCRKSSWRSGLSVSYAMTQHHIYICGFLPYILQVQVQATYIAFCTKQIPVVTQSAIRCQSLFRMIPWCFILSAWTFLQTDQLQSEYIPTAGVRILEFESQVYNGSREVDVEVEMWDCGGGAEYEGCWPAMASGTDGKQYCL